MFDADTIILFARQECKGVAWRHATSYKRAAEENIDRGVTTGQEKNVFIRWGEKEQAHKLHSFDGTVH